MLKTAHHAMETTFAAMEQRAKHCRSPPLTSPPRTCGPSGRTLFWWITNGMHGPDGVRVMPGFSSLDERTRWALINFVHANNPYGVAAAGVHRH